MVGHGRPLAQAVRRHGPLAATSTGYVAALEAFDGIPGLQELKTLGRERGGVAPGRSLLDVGCGFGLETLRLAAAAGPGATVAGIDKSADFIADAAARAAAAGLARRLPGRRRDRPALGRRAASTPYAPSGC